MRPIHTREFIIGTVNSSQNFMVQEVIGFKEASTNITDMQSN